MVQCQGLAGPPRVGLVVAKNAGNAVTRNRIKRRLRHVVPTLPLKPGNDYVIIGASQVAEVSHPNLVGWLERALDGSDDA
jgi:ribonuclease P protein component